MKKKISATLAAVLATTCMSVNAFALDGFSETAEFDKSEYKTGDKATMSVKLNNNTNKDATNVKVNFSVPDNLKVVDEGKVSQTLEKIAAGESAEVTIQVTKTATPVSSNASSNASSTSSNKDANPNTGSNGYIALAGISVLGAAIVICLRKKDKKQATKALALLLSVGMGLSVFPNSIKVSAADSSVPDSSSITDLSSVIDSSSDIDFSSVIDSSSVSDSSSVVDTSSLIDSSSLSESSSQAESSSNTKPSKTTTQINLGTKFETVKFDSKDYDITYSVSFDMSVDGKKYTFDEDFNEGTFNGLGLDVKDELTLNQVQPTAIEKTYKDNDATNGISVTAKADKNALAKPTDTVDLEYILAGFGSEEIESNNVDLALVMDVSGSMSGSRITNAIASAKEVVSNMKKNDRCSIIKFSSTASLVQEFTSDVNEINSSLDCLSAYGGTQIARGINVALDEFDAQKDSTRQKYIILISDGSDYNKDYIQASLDAKDKNVKILSLSIGRDSEQLKTIAQNSDGQYLNSPTADQISEMMKQFAAAVFDNAGKDVVFKMTIAGDVNVDETTINPAPTNVVTNEDGTKTLKWESEKMTITDSTSIKFPVSLENLVKNSKTIITDISCDYTNRDGKAVTVKVDDFVLPTHNYVNSGSWSTVYDSTVNDFEYGNIDWNSGIYDDGTIVVKACASNDANTFDNMVVVNDAEQLSNMKGRYIKISVELNVSSTGYTPELFDIAINPKN